jgi:hypothetical protein
VEGQSFAQCLQSLIAVSQFDLLYDDFSLKPTLIILNPFSTNENHGDPGQKLENSSQQFEKSFQLN